MLILCEILLQRMFTHVLVLLRLVKDHCSFLALRDDVFHRRQRSGVFLWEPECFVCGDLLWDGVLLVRDLSTEDG